MEALSTLLTDVGTVLTSAFGWVATVADTIVGTPILLVGAAMSIGLVCIGIFKSLFAR